MSNTEVYLSVCLSISFLKLRQHSEKYLIDVINTLAKETMN